MKRPPAPGPAAAPAGTTAAPAANLLPCVLDIEASGFGAGSYPIEVGIALPDGSGWCTLVQPVDGWTHWDADAARTHGIERETLIRHGRAPVEVAAELNSRLAGQQVYSDNWGHDYTWLAQLFEAAGASPAFRLHHLRELLEYGGARHFETARAIVTGELGLTRHRASSDARVLQLSVAMALSWD